MISTLLMDTAELYVCTAFPACRRFFYRSHGATAQLHRTQGGDFFFSSTPGMWRSIVSQTSVDFNVLLNQAFKDLTSSRRARQPAYLQYADPAWHPACLV
jgi:hypothetical protein